MQTNYRICSSGLCLLSKFLFLPIMNTCWPVNLLPATSPSERHGGHHAAPGIVPGLWLRIFCQYAVVEVAVSISAQLVCSQSCY